MIPAVSLFIYFFDLIPFGESDYYVDWLDYEIG